MRKCIKLDGKTHFKSATPEQIRKYFNSKGITDQEIDSFDFEETLKSKLLDVGKLFCEKGFHDFAGNDIAALLYCDRWGDEAETNSFLAMTYATLSSFYRNQKEIKQELSIPYIHFLRIETGNNKSNLHKLKGYEIENNKLVKTSDKLIYPDVKTSSFDWKDGVCLPLPDEIDFDVAKLFGYIWAAGAITNNKKGNPALSFSGKEKHRDIFENKVKHLAEKIFNVPFVINNNAVSVYKKNDRDVKFKGIVLERGSNAISSFLESEHNFIHSEKHGNDLPKINWNDENIDGFLAGYIQIKGGFSSYTFKKNTNWVADSTRIYGKGHELADKISALLTIRNHSYYGPYKNYKSRKDDWVIGLNKEPTLYFKKILKK